MDAKAKYEAKPWTRFYDPGTPPTVEIPDLSLPQVFEAAAEKFAGKTALIFYGRRISYAALRGQVERMAHALSSLGLKKGDTLALYLLNSPQFAVAYFAGLRLGAAVTAISPVYTSHEIRHQLTDSGAAILVCQDILYEKVAKAGVTPAHVVLTNVADYLPAWRRWVGRSFLGRIFHKLDIPEASMPPGENMHSFTGLLKRFTGPAPAVEIDPATTVAALPYTGGTTGNPKGVVLTHHNIVACFTQFTAVNAGLLEEGKETTLAFLPFFHIYGQVVVLLAGLLQGHTLVVFTTPDIEEILRALETYRASTFFGVPTLFEYLKEHKDTDKVNWRRLKLVGCGADTLHESTVRDWERRTGTKITEGYGLTEVGAVSHFNPNQRPKPGSFGVPVPNMTAGVVDPDGTAFQEPGEIGELVLNGQNVMEGYLNRPEETGEVFLEIGGEKWLRTGDLVKMDEEGYFHYFDRRKDLIKIKGYSVFAKDVEDVLYEHQQVKSVGVIGVPDAKAGAIIKAIIVPQPEARGQITEEEIVAFCKERLAPYKVPKIVEFRGELPKTDVGKVSRRELRDEVEGARAR